MWQPRQDRKPLLALLSIVCCDKIQKTGGAPPPCAPGRCPTAAGASTQCTLWPGLTPAEKPALSIEQELMKVLVHMTFHPCTHTSTSPCMPTDNRVVSMDNTAGPSATSSTPSAPTVQSTACTRVSTASASSTNTGRSLALISVSTDHTPSNNRHTEPADTHSRNTDFANTSNSCPYKMLQWAISCLITNYVMLSQWLVFSCSICGGQEYDLSSTLLNTLRLPGSKMQEPVSIDLFEMFKES